jgi:hypothetical protein
MAPLIPASPVGSGRLFYSDQGISGRRIARYASHEITQDWIKLVGLGRFELPTSPLSGVRSNQLSYRPGLQPLGLSTQTVFALADQVIQCGHLPGRGEVSVKEVIQPQVPLRLPCYDFTPVMNHTVVIALRS